MADSSYTEEFIGPNQIIRFAPVTKFFQFIISFCFVFETTDRQNKLKFTKRQSKQKRKKETNIQNKNKIKI